MLINTKIIIKNNLNNVLKNVKNVKNWDKANLTSVKTLFHAENKPGRHTVIQRSEGVNSVVDKIKFLFKNIRCQPSAFHIHKEIYVTVRGENLDTNNLVNFNKNIEYTINKSQNHIEAFYKCLIFESKKILKNEGYKSLIQIKGIKGVGKTAFINYFNSTYIPLLQENKIFTVRVSLTKEENHSLGLYQYISYQIYKIFITDYDNKNHTALNINNFEVYLKNSKRPTDRIERDIDLIKNFETNKQGSYFIENHKTLTQYLINFIYERGVVLYIAVDGFDALFHSTEYEEKLNHWIVDYQDFYSKNYPIILVRLIRNDTEQKLKLAQQNRGELKHDAYEFIVEPVDVEKMLLQRLRFLNNYTKDEDQKDKLVLNFENVNWLELDKLICSLLKKDNLNFDKIIKLYNNNFRKFLITYLSLLSEVLKILFKNLEDLETREEKKIVTNDLLSDLSKVVNSRETRKEIKKKHYIAKSHIILGAYYFHFSPYRYEVKDEVLVTNLRYSFCNNISFIPNLFSYSCNIPCNDKCILIKVLILNNLRKWGNLGLLFLIKDISEDLAKIRGNDIDYEFIIKSALQELLFYSCIDENFNEGCSYQITDAGTMVLDVFKNDSDYFMYCSDHIKVPIQVSCMDLKIKKYNIKKYQDIFNFEGTTIRLNNAIIISHILSKRFDNLEIIDFSGINDKLIGNACRLMKNYQQKPSDSKNLNLNADGQNNSYLKEKNSHGYSSIIKENLHPLIMSTNE